jgi:hypothetical protein
VVSGVDPAVIGEPPEPEILKEIMRDPDVFHAELREAGAWVFRRGRHTRRSSRGACPLMPVRDAAVALRILRVSGIYAAV